MSGFEGVAAVASVAQLLAYTISISSRINELRERIREAPRRLEQCSKQITQFAIIAKHVQQNTALQTPDVHPFLTAFVTQAEAIQEIFNKLFKASGKRRYWRIINGDCERKLEERFTDLQKTVHNFTLYMASSNASATQQMNQNIAQVMATTKEIAAGRVIQSDETDEADENAAQASPAQSRNLHPPRVSYPLIDLSGGQNYFENNDVENNGIVCAGNFIDEPQTIATTIHASAAKPVPGNLFVRNQFTSNMIVHHGNVGRNTEGSHFKGNKVEKNEGYRQGNYGNVFDRDQDFARLIADTREHARAGMRSDQASSRSKTFDGKSGDEGGARI
ncbi:hypothetical protein DL769_001499 [Monosporascus sp. CRB-8-3]|nr:hypothetical protein DL769_001499 [Monosporascus sp. CRB-8-3]